MLLVTSSFGSSAQQSSSNFVQINHSPSNPVIDSIVQFRVVMKNGSISQLVNLTLILNTNVTSRYQMVQNQNQFSYEFLFTEAQQASYFVEFYTTEGLEEISEIIEFNVVDRVNGQNMSFQNNITTQLQAGNTSLNSIDGNFHLQLKLNSSIEVQVEERAIPTIPGRVILSPNYRIQVNNSKAVIGADLSMIYDQSAVDQFGIEPLLITYSTRNESNAVWKDLDADIDTVNNTAQISLTHFSEWVITATIPQIRFISIPEPLKTEVGTYEDIRTDVKNFGSYAGTNLTVRLISPSTALTNNFSTELVIDRITPLEEIILNWQIYFVESGNYTLIFIVEGQDIDGDVIQVHIEVTPIATSSNENAVIFQSQFTIVMLVVGVILYKRRS